MIEVWKVVDETGDGRYTSCCVIGKAELEYPMGEVVRGHPKTIGPVCFERLEDAKRWIGANMSLMVLRCEAPRIAVRPVRLSNWLCGLAGFQYRRRREPPLGFCVRMAAPPGTVAVPWLRPLEVVEL